MDALKRAEQAREANDGARPSADPEANPAIPELSLDPLDPPARGTVDNSVTGAFSLDPVATEDELAGGLSLEPVSLENSGVSRESAETGIDLFKIGEQPHGDDAADDMRLGVDSPAADTDSSSAMPPIRLSASTRAEDTSATLPSLKSLQASVDSYFDGSDSMPLAMEPVSPERFAANGARPAAALGASAGGQAKTGRAPSNAGQRLGEDLDAQRAAQNLFVARQAQTSGRATRVLLLFVLPLLLVMGLFGGGWYYINVASAPSVVMRTVGRPAAAPRPSNVAPAAPIAPVPKTAAAVLAQAAPAPGAEPSNAELVRRARAALAAGAAVANAQETSAATLDGASRQSAQLTVPAPAADLSIKPPAPKIIEPPKPPVKKVEPKPAEPRLSDQQFARALAKAEARLPRPAPKVGAIRIAKSRPRPQTEPQLERGYQAFQRGDLNAAERVYKRVLRAQPTSRDALLGVAAVAVTRGNVDSAAAIYSRLLVLNPQDSLAKAALFNIRQSDDVTESVSQLKTMLADEPKAAHLHFSLGNAYAQKERWPEAQAAYFSAFRYDSNNADYAFNLAVSLEHLNQVRAALDYYQRALVLARGQEVGFAASSVHERLAAIGDGN